MSAFPEEEVLSQFVSITLALLIAFQTAAFASQVDCDHLLTTPEQQSSAFLHELEAATQGRPEIKRVFLRLRLRLARSRILRECAANGSCTKSQVAIAVKEAVQASSSNRDALGYGFLIGGMIANAAVSAGVTGWVNPQAEFLPTLVGFTLGQATFIAASLLSPFSEPLSAKMRRFSFALKGKNQGEPAQVANSELEAKADAIHATYTLREQYAVDRIFVYRNAIRLNFQTAALALQSHDAAAVAAEIADAAMSGYRYFKDIDPREPAIVNTIYASFLVKLEEPSRLKDAVMRIIRERDLSLDAKAQAYYERALAAWLG
jgi:hypothetical protein